MFNWQGRTITDIYPSMPINPLLSEIGSIPAKLLLDFWQRSYTYRLLILLDYHLTKQILSINSRDGNESSQLGEQLDDTSMWAKSAKSKLLGHLLAQQMAINNAIVFADAIKPIQSFDLNASFSDINMEEKKKAVEEAKKYNIGHIFWVDGSKLSQGNATAAV